MTLNLPPPAPGVTAVDAIKNCTCDCCPYWHNPLAQPVGVCIYNPPVPIMVGLQQLPPAAIVDPKQPQMAMAMPIVQPHFPLRGPKDGCGRHPKRYQ